MAVSPFNFAGALELLDPGRRSSVLFDKLLGGALFAGTAAAAVAGGPVAGLTVTGFLSLVDPKNEATKLLSPLVTSTVDRLRGTGGRTEYELIVAAHTITVLSSFFDGLRSELAHLYADLELTDAELSRLSGLTADAHGRGMVAALLEFDVPLPSPQHGLAKNLEQKLMPWFHQLGSRCVSFFEGLEAWKPHVTSADRIARRAADFYRNRMLQLGTQPPFALWLTLNEHAATRAAVSDSAETTSVALSKLRDLLALAVAGAPPAPASYREQLTSIAQEVLDEPLIRSGQRTLASPKVRDGFVEPAFQLVAASRTSRVASETWWSELRVHESLVDYLASYLASDSSTVLPLLLLGHPGAGKSLLTEVLAAQLPASSFAVVRVPLRHVNTDDELAVQITKELQRALQRPTADIEDLRAECAACAECRQAGADTCPHRCRLVVLLDGFDELVQATGATQSGYLNKVVAFQKRARTLGVPTAVMITSRTVVADQAEIPPGTPVVKLIEFDQPRIDRWVTTWNAAHAQTSGFAPLDATELTAQPSVAELARQPLLLLILAVYLAELGTSTIGGPELTETTLYGRILDHFIKRQVSEKSLPGAAPESVTQLERLQRRNLQYAAIGMFNRGRQHLTDDELDADLRALDPSHTPTGEPQPLRHAHRVLGEFMFVHNAKADREQQAAYEFLHATFGEYLVAELVHELITHVTRVREVELSAPNFPSPSLNDQLFRRLLSHQPLSARRPVLSFLHSLSRVAENRDGIFATLTDLLYSAQLQPDTSGDPYQPISYDPVRRRAAYTANLTLLRVILDPEPVPVSGLVRQADVWERLVRLWRAGLDETTWSTIVDTLGTTPFVAGELRICVRGNLMMSPEMSEAELIGDRDTMARLASSEFVLLEDNELWTDPQIDLANVIGRILYAVTETPYVDRLLPHDLGWFQTVLELTTAHGLNRTLRCNLLNLLARSATRLPIEYLDQMLDDLLPLPIPEVAVDLAAIVAAKPLLLAKNPDVSSAIMSAPTSHAAALIPTLWQASMHCPESVRPLLVWMVETVNQDVVVEGEQFDPAYFSPVLMTYLRVEQPAEWISDPTALATLDGLDAQILATIEPEDALFAAETWTTHMTYFATRYLDARGRPTGSGTGLLSSLRRLAGETADLSPTDDLGQRLPT